jgi:ABC-type branched-subunit amino acid transport system substrate-binding protein
MERRWYLLFAIAAVGLLLFAGCAQKPAEKAPEAVTTPPPTKEEAPPKVEEIKIGVLLPLSGNLAPFGEGMVKGARVAEKEINDAGGVLGAKVKLVVEDTATDPAKAVDAAQKLIKIDGIQAIVGAAASSSTLAVAPICEENHVVLVSPASTSPLVTDAGDYVFRVVASDTLQGKVLADLAIGQGYKKAATFVINNDYGIGLQEVFKESFEAKGGSVVVQIQYDPGKGDYRTELQQVKDSGAEMIMFVSYPEDASVILKQAMELGLPQKWIAAEGIASKEMFSYAGMKEAMEGMLLTKPASATDSEEYQHFYKLFKAMYPDEEPGIYADTTYDATMMIAKAIEKAGSYDGEKIKDALYEISKGYMGATGDKTFDENGDILYQDYVIFKATNGKFEEVGMWKKGKLEMK